MGPTTRVVLKCMSWSRSIIYLHNFSIPLTPAREIKDHPTVRQNLRSMRKRYPNRRYFISSYRG